MPSPMRLLFFTRAQFAPTALSFETPCEIELGRGPSDSAAPTARRVGPAHYRVDVPRPSLSERHAVITVRDGRATLRNLDPRNGTTVRLGPHDVVPLDEAPVWLGDELTVRTEDSRWSIPSPLLTPPSAPLLAWMRTSLSSRGLRIEPVTEGPDAYRLHGDPGGFRLEPDRPGRTVDLEDTRWVTHVVSSYNASLARDALASTWRFTAASPARRRTLRLAHEIAPTRLPVLLLGPTGSGKDVLANDIHTHSPVASGPFVSVNCALLHRERAESTLFGHARGAFTGASTDQQGLVAAADEGTLFLDEVAELPLDVQAQLLRFLDARDGEHRRMGETRPRRASVRVIAATNVDLRERIKSQLFREDLFFRLEGLSLSVAPPEPADIEALTSVLFLEQLARSAPRATSRATPAPPPLDEPTLASLARTAAARPWAGNVRALRYAIERCVALRDPARSWEEQWRRTLDLEPARPELSPPPPRTPLPPALPLPNVSPSELGRLLSTVLFLTAALDATDRASLARATDMSYQGADARLEKLGLTVGDRDAIRVRLDELTHELHALTARSPEARALFSRLLAG